MGDTVDQFGNGRSYRSGELSHVAEAVEYHEKLREKKIERNGKFTR